MENHCPNCKQIITGNFCSNCGQKKYKRIDRKYLWEAIQYTVLHTNKGFLYSVKRILRNPGKTAREFIDGKRVDHYKPLLLAFVLSGISTFLAFKVLGLYDVISEHYASTVSTANSEFMSDYMAFLASYNSLLMLLALPFFAIATKLAFWKWGHNYYEHIVMNAYVLSFYTLLSILILYPIMYLFRSDASSVMMISNISMILIPIILIWFYRGFYPEKKLGSIIGRVVFAVVLIVLGFIGTLIFAMIAGFVFALLKGPEALEYFRPQ